MMSGGRQYPINILDHIKIKSDERETIAFFDSSEKVYVDLKNTTHFIDSTIRTYNKNKVQHIETISEMIDKNNLFVLLLNSNGDIRLELDRDKSFELLDVTKKIRKIGKSEIQKIEIISSEVSNICSKVFKISKKDKEMFEKLLKEFVFIELVKDCNDGRKVATRKIGNVLDYKINRILKFLNINVNLSKISDFMIEYNRDFIKVNGQEYLSLKEDIYRDKIITLKANNI